MSYTSLIPFVGKQPQSEVIFGTSWGGAARIWDALFGAHVPKEHEFDSWIIDPHDRRLWDLAFNTDLPAYERAALAFTFDLFYVRNDHFGNLAGHLRLFVRKYPVIGAHADHLPAWARWLEEHLQGEVEAVALRCTSVTQNLWHRPTKCEHCGNLTEETEPVWLCDGTEVYDWLMTSTEKDKFKKT